MALIHSLRKSRIIMVPPRKLSQQPVHSIRSLSKAVSFKRVRHQEGATYAAGTWGIVPWRTLALPTRGYSAIDM